MNQTSDFQKIDELLSGASATNRERADIILSLNAFGPRYALLLADFLKSNAGAPEIFLENYRRKYIAQLRGDRALWGSILKEENKYLDSVPE